MVIDENKNKDKDTNTKTQQDKEKPTAVVVEEPDFEVLSNPARVTRAQLSKISFDIDPRYVPVTEGVHGIVLLRDTKPGEQEQIIPATLPTSAGAGVMDDEANEPEAPEAFEFLGK